MAILIETIGWIGSVMIVLAYALNMYKKMASDAVAYYLLNIAGSGCLVIYTLYKQANASAVVNMIWVFIALLALLRKK